MAAPIRREGTGLASPSLHTVRASRVAPRARAWLAVTTNGRVLHTFDAAIYLVNDDGEVLSLTASVLGPLSLVIPTPRLRQFVTAGDPVHVDAGTVETGRLRVILADAADWDSRPPWQDLVAHRAVFAPGWDHWTEVVLRHSPAGSLASLLGPEDWRVTPGAIPARLHAAAGAAARRLIDSLEAELRLGRRTPSIAEASRGLAGLGSGFTPAGDDFLVGTMYALWSSCRAGQAADLSASIANAAVPRTTRVSGALLRAAAAGEAGESWHRLVSALLSRDVGSVESALAGIAAIGHTSGADALAGYLLTLGAALSFG